jgi:hypothetical protein
MEFGELFTVIVPPTVRLETAITLKTSQAEHAQYELLAALPIARPGRYQVRVVVRIERLKLRGSVFADVDVPEFHDQAVTPVPLVMTSSPASPSAPLDAFAGLLPRLPTSHRSFAATEHVSILARVVQGAQKLLSPVSLGVTVEDTRGQRVFDHTERLAPPPTLAGRSIDQAFDLPITSLPVGDYILTVTAKLADGKLSVRTLRFSRRQITSRPTPSGLTTSARNQTPETLPESRRGTFIKACDLRRHGCWANPQG